MSGRKARHFHAGKLRKEIDGVEYVEVAESNGKVFVASDGTFISKNHRWRPYLGSVARDGYRHVYIVGRRPTAARVVYEVLVGQIPDGMEIDHVNTERGDNRLENLRIVTHRENLLNPITRPRRSKACARNGSLSVKSQGRDKIMVAMRIGWEAWKKPVRVTIDGVSTDYDTAKEAAKAIGVAPCTLKNMIAGIIKHHWGKLNGVSAEYIQKGACNV